MRRTIWHIITIGILLGCTPSGSELPEDFFELAIPRGFPEPIIPKDNLMSTSRVALGKLLFSDTRLSSDGTKSCSSCHLQEKAFTDNTPFSIGVEARKSKRNAPTLANLAWADRLMFDGGVPTLELQVLAPIHDFNEMNHDIDEIAKALRKDVEINELSRKAYHRDIDPFVIIRAIAAFERTLISGNSRYDQYMNGDTSKLTTIETRGMELFFSEKTKCGTCHGGFNFTDNAFYNIGLYEEYPDMGRELITHKSSDNGKFKVPTLRNIALTSPYMHDGSISNLREVISHFNTGGKAHPNKDEHIQPLGLTDLEIKELESFLLSLTDESFVNP